MKRSNVNQTVAALVAVGVILAGCSSGDDDDADTAPVTDDAGDGDRRRIFDDDVGDDPGGDRDDGDDGADSDGDAESSLVDADDADDMAIARSQGDVGTAATLPSAGRVEAAADEAADAEGGLFGAEPERPDPDDERLRDNTFADYGYRDFVDADDDPLSTFALDVDTGSYTVARRWIDEGTLPPIESVRPEEYVNAFDYDYDTPRNGLEISVDGGPSPFDDDHYLVRVGVQGEIVDDRDRGPAALTFVIDTSGSMDRDNRIGLVKRALERLVAELDTDDTVAIVTYGDGAAVLLEPTTIRDRDRVLEVIDGLRTDGSTNLEAGLRRGYELADTAYVPGGINRVVLASDGVANVGLTDPNGLVGLIRDDADRGIQLVTIGVGMGNFNDVVMETLANDGDGFYAYVDDLTEAERLFSDELVSTLLTVAIDAKIQVEFDDDAVESYRLLGYENRAVLDDDFRNDDVDAGELGAGHQATALYELVLRDGLSPSDRLATVSMRWEDPDDGNVIETRLELTGSLPELRWSDTTEDFRLAVTVAALAEVLRASPHADGVDLDDVAREIEEFERTWAVDELAELVESARRLR